MDNCSNNSGWGLLVELGCTRNVYLIGASTEHNTYSIDVCTNCINGINQLLYTYFNFL